MRKKNRMADRGARIVATSSFLHLPSSCAMIPSVKMENEGFCSLAKRG